MTTKKKSQDKDKDKDKDSKDDGASRDNAS
jgi:hypothetical protein